MDTKNVGLTVGELKKLLEEFDDDLAVMSDGCDCEGRAVGVRYQEGWWEDGKAYVLVARE